MWIGTLTTKGQITVPKAIRQHLKLRTGHRVEFYVDSSGQVILRPLSRSIRSIKGIVRSPHRRPVTVEEMNEATARGFSGT